MIKYSCSTDKVVFSLFNLLEAGYIDEIYRVSKSWFKHTGNEITRRFLSELIRSIDNKNYNEIRSILRYWQAELSNFGKNGFKKDVSLADESNFMEWLLNGNK